jgi:predicted aspartyl protease
VGQVNRAPRSIDDPRTAATSLRSWSTRVSEYNWVPSEVLLDLGVTPVRINRFETADGRLLEREIGFALVYAGVRSALSVVFATEGDMVLLGAHGLEGLNLRVDLGRKELVPAGPVPAAAAA